MDESVVKHLDSQVGTLRLSEAIRIGARIRPQCTGVMFSNGKSCALGAAYEAITGEYVADQEWHGEVLSFLSDRFNYYFLTSELGLKNDDGWTREQVADYAESKGM